MRTIKQDSRTTTQDDSAHTMHISELSICEAADLLRSRQITSRALTEAYLARIKRLDGDLNAYVTVTEELALSQANACDVELEQGLWRGPLHGIPIALKDNIDTAGVLTSAASALFKERVPEQDAQVYQRLRACGSVLLGKLNMHEFAFGGTSVISAFGPVRNPWSLEHIAGGSSGGAGAAVAARLCAAAIGTDTLASIRMPAAHCGVVGLKGTHGLASIRGIVPLAESLDHVGPLCRTVADCALVLGAIAGYDPGDPVSLRTEVPTFMNAVYMPTRQLRLGIPITPFYDDLDPEIQQAMTKALEVLSGLTATQQNVSLPELPDYSPLLAESYAFHEEWLVDGNRQDLYQTSTFENLMRLAAVQTPTYYHARRQLALARMAIDQVFAEVDLLVTPTTACLPTTVDNALQPGNSGSETLSVRNTAPFNVFGIPSISVPCGFSANGLPIGLQISGLRLQEVSVLALAHAFEQSTEWHRRQPTR
jgi:aspartyl-tRNA(Asn)/glutamyl-tRNA(Gln) amidotransferase subunit A